MATTIKLKNGSGAPTTGDLVQGEPAFDLTNKRLYTEDSGGTVIEVGTNPTSLTTTTVSATGSVTGQKLVASDGLLELDDNGTHNGIINVPASLFINIDSDNTNTGEDFVIAKDRTSASGGTELFRVQEDGNVGIGTASPSTSLDVVRAGAMPLRVQSTSGTECQINMVNTGGNVQLEAHSGNFTIDADNVGIGTTSPASLIHGMSGDLFLTANSTAADSGQGIYFQSTTSGWSTSGAHGAIFGKRVDASNGYLRFDTRSGGTTAERMRIDSSGRVGIGTNAPISDLTVSNASGGEITLRYTGNSGYTSIQTDAANDLIFGTGVGASERMRIDSSGNLILKPSGKLYLESSSGFSPYLVEASNALTVNTNGAERMRIDSSGDVLIGTNATSYLNAANRQVCHVNGGTDGAILALTGTASGSYPGSTGDFYIASGASGTTNTSLVTRSNGYMNFYTNNTERMRLDSSGNLLVGTTSSSPTTKVNITQPANAIGAYIFASGATYTSSVLSVQGNLSSTNETYVLADFLNGAGTGRAKIYDSGDIDNTNNAYGALSDAKLKTEIIDASSQWDDIKALRFRKYKMIADPEQRVQMGVIAQEVEEAGMSGLVRETADKDLEGNDLGTTTKSVKYSVLYTKAIKALQEAMTRIETLEAEVAALKGE